jgi:hypothetical protein
MSPQALHDIRRKLRILNHAKESGNVSQTCRYFGVSREIFYRRRCAYEKDGETALINSKPCPQNPKRRAPPHIEEKILHLRRTYHLGQRPVHWYLLPYGLKVSSGRSTTSSSVTASTACLVTRGGTGRGSGSAPRSRCRDITSGSMLSS